jgi:hypothetical protein
MINNLQLISALKKEIDMAIIENTSFSENRYLEINKILGNFDKTKNEVKEILLDKISAYLKFSEILNENKMRTFLNSDKFDIFYQKFSLIISQFTQDDFDSIGMIQTSERVRSLINCFTMLDENGFPFVNSRKINFWSGQNARLRAQSDDALTDNKVPSISIGFDICTIIQKIERKNNSFILSSFLPSIISSVYASQARGEVNVYLSSDKLSEPSSISVGNNFWNGELPVLQKLYQQNLIRKIWIHLQIEKDTWAPPIDLNSEEANHIRLIRRHAYLSNNPMLNDSDLSSFIVEQKMGPTEYSAWCQNAASRPFITLGKIRQIARIWKKIALKNKLTVGTNRISVVPQWIDLPADDYSKLARFEDEQFKTLNLLVNQYQSIPKNSEIKLKERIQSLQMIIDFLSSWMMSESLEYRIRFLKNIKKIAEGKQSYLRELDMGYSSGQFELEYLKSYHLGLPSSILKYKPLYLIHDRRYDSSKGVYWGEFWFETIDPCHRQLTTYHDLWTKQTEKKENLLAFFLWLENQNLHKDIPYIEFLNEEQLQESIVEIDNGLLYHDASIDKKLINFNEEGKEYIFCIDLSERLFLRKATKKIHHVSFSHGKPVLGAGNMTVVNGVIHSIQIDSGRYLPHLEHGLQTLAILKNKGANIGSDVPFTYYDSFGKKHNVLISDVI